MVELTVRGARQRILRLRLLACVAAMVLGVAGQAALIPAHAVTPSATTTAPAPPTTFTGTLAGKIATMTWTNPTDPGLTGVVVRGLSGTTVPGPTVGALIADTLSQTATTPTLSTGTYTFAAYAHDATPTYSSPAAVWVVTVPPPPPVSNFLGTLVTPSSVKLTWVNPISPILTGVMVRRYLPSEIVGLATGTLLTDTLTQQATDSGLAPAATYVYAAFAHDDAGHYSVPRTWTARTSLRWGAPTVVDHLVGGPTAVSCATTTYCVAVDATGRALTFNGSIWTAPAQVLGADASGTADGFLSVDCPTVAFCAATTGTGRFLVSHYGVWRAMPTPGSGGSWYALDCTSSTFCAAVNADGRVTTFNGTAWRAPTSLGTPGVVWRDVSCVSPTMCLAVAGAGRYVYTARLTGSTWAAQRVGAVAGDQWQVSCTSTTFCMMVGRSGLSLRYNGSTYVVIPDYQGDANEVSCTTPTSCVLVGFDATARWDGTAWSPLTHPVFPYSLGEAVSCVQSSCVVVSGFGWSTRLTGATWSVPTYVDKTAGRLAQVSCASTTACTALDDFGASVRWNGTSWTVPNGPISSPGGRLSCPTDAMCMLTDGQNEGYRTWSSGTWQAAKTTYPRQLDLVACADATWCMASDGQGQTHVWNGTSWGAGLTVPGETQWMSQLSCPSRTMCMALDPTGKWTRWNGTSWSVPAVMGNGMGFVDHLHCPSATMCMATDSSDRLYMVSDGLSFQGPSPMPAANVESLSCPTVDACYALSYDGGVTRFLDGQWAVDTTPGGLTAADSPMAIECPTRTACLEIGTTKAVWSS